MPYDESTAAISSPTRTTLRVASSVRNEPVAAYSSPAGMV